MITISWHPLEVLAIKPFIDSVGCPSNFIFFTIKVVGIHICEINNIAPWMIESGSMIEMMCADQK